MSAAFFTSTPGVEIDRIAVAIPFLSMRSSEISGLHFGRFPIISFAALIAPGVKK